MLYTVRPLEAIYRPEESTQKEAKEECVFEIQNGYVFTKKCEENYIIDHIFSTDMQDYLNVEYQPGSVYK